MSAPASPNESPRLALDLALAAVGTARKRVIPPYHPRAPVYQCHAGLEPRGPPLHLNATECTITVLSPVLQESVSVHSSADEAAVPRRRHGQGAADAARAGTLHHQLTAGERSGAARTLDLRAQVLPGADFRPGPTALQAMSANRASCTGSRRSNSQ